MFRFFLPAVLFLTVTLLGACSSGEPQPPKPSSAKETKTETSDLNKIKDDVSNQAESEAMLAKKAKLAEEKRLAQNARLAEETRLAEKTQLAEKAAQKIEVEKVAAERIAAEKNMADRAAVQAQAKANKADAVQKAQKIALLVETQRLEQQQKQAKIAEQLRAQEAAKLQAELQANAQANSQAEAMKDRVIASGRFTKKKKFINGTWSIVMEGGKRYLRFDEAFKTKWAADLQIFLSPQSIAAANHKNAGQNVYRLAPLTAKKGAQSYIIPDDVDLSIYNSILIHCEEYALLWGGADIR